MELLVCRAPTVTRHCDTSACGYHPIFTWYFIIYYKFPFHFCVKTLFCLSVLHICHVHVQIIRILKSIDGVKFFYLSATADSVDSVRRKRRWNRNIDLTNDLSRFIFVLFHLCFIDLFVWHQFPFRRFYSLLFQIDVSAYCQSAIHSHQHLKCAIFNHISVSIYFVYTFSCKLVKPLMHSLASSR